jgi:hypothetical protein
LDLIRLIRGTWDFSRLAPNAAGNTFEGLRMPGKSKPNRTRPKALEGSTVIKVRVSADEARRLDKIVAAGGFPSRSEAVRHWIMIESPVE